MSQGRDPYGWRAELQIDRHDSKGICVGSEAHVGRRHHGKEVNLLLKRPDMREKLAQRWLKPESSTPEARLNTDLERWGKIVTERGLAAQ